MDDRLDIDWNRIGKKWVACFDLLGFSEYVKDNDPLYIFYRWELLHAEFRNTLKRYPKLDFVHFSDTFLIYAPDDLAGSFGQIERCSRWFFQNAILRRYPLCGAMACDEFYADKPNGVFLGKALVEAHEYSKKFNWIGYTFCPSVLSRLQHPEVNLPSIPSRFWKADAPIASGAEETVALLCGAGQGLDYITALEEMKLLTFEDMTRRQKPPHKIARVQAKYDNSIQFIQRFETTEQAARGSSSRMMVI